MTFQLRKRAKPVQRLVLGAMFISPGQFVELQLPIETKSAQSRHDFGSARLAARQRLALLGWKRVKVRGQRKGVLAKVQPGLLDVHLRSVDRAAISGITVTRISPRRLDAHDNLRSAFKHVIDDVCIWIELGGDITARDLAGIGRFDDKLITTGRIQCHYEQTTHETDRRLQGIRIRLHLGQSPTMQL